MTLVASHPVYEGHFPGNPIAPGVCTLHMITECAEQILGHSVFLQKAPVVKFLEFIRPQLNRHLVIDITIDDTDNMMLKAVVMSELKILMSCKLQLAKVLCNKT